MLLFKLTDSELNAVMTASRPLPVDLRDAFLKAVADELAGGAIAGPRRCLPGVPRSAARLQCGIPSWTLSDDGGRAMTPAERVQIEQRGAQAEKEREQQRRRAETSEAAAVHRRDMSNKLVFKTRRGRPRVAGARRGTATAAAGREALVHVDPGARSVPTRHAHEVTAKIF